MTVKRKQNESVIYSILRMSQKALMVVLILIGVGYIGGIISILFSPDLAKPLSDFTQVFIPLFQLEIGVYGLGSTLENVQKIRAQIDTANAKNDENAAKTAENESESTNG